MVLIQMFNFWLKLVGDQYEKNVRERRVYLTLLTLTPEYVFQCARLSAKLIRKSMSDVYKFYNISLRQIHSRTVIRSDMKVALGRPNPGVSQGALS